MLVSAYSPKQPFEGVYLGRADGPSSWQDRARQTGSVSGATNYRLDVSTSNSFTNYVPGYNNLDVGNTTSYNVIGLSANTNYYYRVRAYNGCAASPNSNIINVKTKLH